MPLDRVAARLRQRIPATAWAAFLSCFLSGYLIHLFAFTNLIPNSDGLSRVFDPQQMTVSGRWFLHYASSLNSFTQMLSPHRLSVHGVPLPGGGGSRPNPGAAQPRPIRPGWRAHGRLPLSGIHLPLYVHRLRLLPGHPAGGAVSLAGAEGRLAPAALRPASFWPCPWGSIRPTPRWPSPCPCWRCSGRAWTTGPTGRAPSSWACA